MESRNLIPYLCLHGHFLNRITCFVHRHINPGQCNAKRNTNFTRIESRCENTTNTVIFALTGKFNDFKLIEPKDASLDNIMLHLYLYNMINISISCHNDFGGHTFLIIKHNDVFYIIQSYIFEYNLRIHVANESQVELYLNHYLTIFSKYLWSQKDVDLWKCITGVIIPEYNDIKPKIFTYWCSDSFSLNYKEYVKDLLDEALIKLDNSNLEDIIDVFDNVTIKQIKDNIEQALNDLDLSCNVKFEELTDDGFFK